MKFVVTGALGHIGSRLIRDLPEHFPGAEIVMIDSMMTQRYASLFGLSGSGRYQFVEADVREIDLRSLFEGASAVVHLAAITDPGGSVGRAVEVEANNFRATAKVAEACAVTGAPLIAISSTSVYGTEASEVDEDCGPNDLRPQSPYAETKLKEEKLVAEMVQTGKLRAVSCRFGTIFGVSPGMRFHTAVNKFCWQAVMGTPLSVWRTAYDQKRPYLDLADAVRAIAFLVERNLFDGRVYNVVTLNAPVRDIVETISSFVPGLEIALVDSPIMNTLSYDVSSKRITQQGFAFSGDLRTSVGQTIALLKAANNRQREGVR